MTPGNVGDPRYLASGMEQPLDQRPKEPVRATAHLRLEAAIVADMQSLGIDPALIYAFQHTGVIVTEDTIEHLSDAQLVGWQAAVDRYRAIA